MFLVLVVLSMSSALQGLEDSSYGDLFQPLSISWPSIWINSKFEVNSNYIESAKTIYFYFSIDGLSLDISNFYSALRMPDETEYTPCRLSQFSSVENDWKASCNYSFESTNLIYGPIEFILSESRNGRIIAQDFTAGYFALLEGTEHFSAEPLEVSFEDLEVNHRVEELDNLEFSFRLPSNKGIHSGDYFEIFPSRLFGFNYAKLDMRDFNYDNESYCSPSLEIQSHNKDSGIIDESTVIYVYGCYDDIYANTEVSFTILGFTNPKVTNIGDVYSWTLKIWRYGTNTLIAKYKGTGPKSKIEPGHLSILEWSPYYKSAFNRSENFFNELTTFWSIEFKVEHDVPPLGSIIVTYTDVVLDLYQECSDFSSIRVFITSDTPSNFTYKQISQSEIKIEIDSDNPLKASSIITLTNYLTILSSTNNISASVKTFDGISVIDESESPFSIELGSKEKNVYITGAKAELLEIDDYSIINKVNKAGNFELEITFEPQIDLEAGDIIEIFMPVNIGSSPSINEIVFTTRIWGEYDDHYIGPTEGDINFERGKIKYTLKSSVQAYIEFTIRLGAGSISSQTTVYTPLLFPVGPTEIIMKIEKLSKFYYSSIIMCFIIDDIEVSYNNLCNNALLNSISLANIEYKSPQYILKPEVSLKIVFNFGDISPIISSDYSPGDLYPSKSSRNTLKYESDSEIYYLEYNSLISGTVSFIIPVDLKKFVSKMTVTINALYRKKYYKIYKGSTDSLKHSNEVINTGSPSASDFNSSIETSSSVKIILKTSPEADLDSNGIINDAVTYSSFLILPQGFKTIHENFITNSITSSNHNFKFNIYFKESFGSVSEIEGVEYFFYLSIIPSSIIITETDHVQYYLTYVYDSEFSNKNCVFLQGKITTGPGKILISDYYPSTITNSWYNSRTTQVRLNFKLKLNLDPGSIIKITLDYWKIYDSLDCIIKVESIRIGCRINDNNLISLSIDKVISSGTLFNIIISNAELPDIGTINPFEGFKSIMIEKDNNNYFIWENSGSETTTIPSDPEFIPIQQSSNSEIWVYPNILGSQKVFFGLNFLSIYEIPRGATVSISGQFSDHLDIEQDLWCSHSYKSAKVYLNTLFIVTEVPIKANSFFEIILDYAFDLNTLESSDFFVKVICDDTLSTKLIDDSIKEKEKKLKILPRLTSNIINLEFYSEIMSPGYISWHTFELTLDTETPNFFSIDFDACGNYNSIPGPSNQFSRLNDLKYIEAYDELGKSLICSANHWIVSCNYNKKIMAMRAFTIKMKLTTPQSSGWFNVYIKDQYDNLLFQPYYAKDKQKMFFNTKIKDSINLYFVEIEKDSESLSLWVNINKQFENGLSLTIIFPEPYSDLLAIYKKKECSIYNYYYNRYAYLDFTIDANFLKINIDDDLRFDSENFWTILNFEQFGYPGYGFPSEDLKFEPNDFDYLSRKFSIFAQDSSNIVRKSSFDNLNAAFTGFYNDYGKLSLTNHLDSHILITAGTFCGPFTIGLDEHDTSDSLLELVGTVSFSGFGSNAGISISNDGHFSLDQNTKYVDIYIGADSTTKYGLYYIYWDLIQDNVNERKYSKYIKPRPTFIEVSNNKIYKIILPEEDIYVNPKTHSLPILINIFSETQTIYPYNDLFIVLTPEDSSKNIVIEPNPVILSPSFPKNKFIISCDDCTEVKDYIINARVDGKDAKTFQITEKILFISKAEYSKTGKITYSLSKPTSVGFDFNINSDSKGILTWAIVSDNIFNDDDFEYIKILRKVHSITSEDSNLSIEEHIKEIKQKYQEIFTSYYEEYIFKGLMYQGRFIMIPGQSLVNKGENSIMSVDFLVPETKYVIISYIDNLSGNILQKTLEKITTKSLKNHALITFRQQYSDEDSNININILIEQVANIINWKKELISITELDRRHIQSGIDLLFLADPTKVEDCFELLSENKYSIERITGYTADISSIQRNIYQARFIDYAWDLQDIVLIFNFTSDSDGIIKCIVIDKTDIKITTDTIFWEEIEHNNYTIGSLYFSVYEHEAYSIYINFTDFGSDALLYNYKIGCIICDKYPGYPSCSEPIDKYINLKQSTSSFGILWLVVINYIIF